MIPVRVSILIEGSPPDMTDMQVINAFHEMLDESQLGIREREGSIDYVTLRATSVTLDFGPMG